MSAYPKQVAAAHELPSEVLDRILTERVQELLAFDILDIPGVREALLQHWHDYLVEDYNESPEYYCLISDIED